MRALLVLLMVSLAAATTAYAYGHAEVAGGLTSVIVHSGDVVLTEPAMLLLSGALLLGLGGAVRRFSF